MELSPVVQAFICEHANDNTDKLLLSASRYPEIDVPFAVNQIIARRQIQDKLPGWYGVEDLIYPSRLSAEQCSSEATARYKQGLLRGERVCDLTGGLGVDAYFFARKAREVVYVERFAEYCAAARHNFKVLGEPQIKVVNADAREIAGSIEADTFYLDPARRAECNKRVFALSDCEPDVLQLKPLLLERAQRVIVKVSPMADVEETLRLLPETKEVHIVAVKNECKEVLFVLEGEVLPADGRSVKMYTVHLRPSDAPQIFSFSLEEEKAADCVPTATVKKYLYEPHAALLKSGAFKLTALRYGLLKLHRHSHLYTSGEKREDFPGRVFEVEETLEFSGKWLKQAGKQIPKANITVRNFPLTVAELRKRSGIKEGGDIYLFATTLSDGQKVFIKAHKS